jgi:hypothetical protein
VGVKKSFPLFICFFLEGILTKKRIIIEQHSVKLNQLNIYITYDLFLANLLIFVFNKTKKEI